MPADPTPIRDLLRNLRDDCGHHDAPETQEEAEAALAALDALVEERQLPACVWVLSRGARYREHIEYHDVMSAHRSRDSAEREARRYMGGGTPQPWALAEDAVHTVTWERGCDYVQIECFEVQP